MHRKPILFCLILLLPIGIAHASTYYVSPAGDDTADGQSTGHPWKSLAKVDAFPFLPGDNILFMRSGEWHESLVASSNGKSGLPITYDAYGDGAKPKFWGSIVLLNAAFSPSGDGKYAYPLKAQADSALVDHAFIPSGWAGGVLTISTSSDPRKDNKIYTACIRGNVIFSNRKSHLVFRNLIVDETAGQLTDGAVQGYGVRIEGSTDVLVESCEAYRCGRHHFAAINSTEFVGRHLLAGYVQPMTPGDNTPYVSYADAGAPVAHCTSVWDDIAADHLEDGKGGKSVMFVSHGDHQGSIVLKNSTSFTKISLMTAPVVVLGVTLKENASIENWGPGVLIDSVTMLDSSAIDQWASGGMIQNCVARLDSIGSGPTGYSTAILFRDKAARNVVRFNTLVTARFSCLTLAGADSATKWYGNIMVADGATIAKASGELERGDFTFADFNFYAPAATFAGKTFAQWQAQGWDKHSLSGDPGFKDAAKGDFALVSDSKCIAAAAIAQTDVPLLDATGNKRASNPADIGAYRVSNK